MTDISPDPNDSISEAAFITDSQYQPAPTGIQQTVFTCPVCGAVVVQVVGNTMQFLFSHIRGQTDQPDAQGYIPLVFCHTVLDQGMFVPPRDYVPPIALNDPYLNVQSSVMVPHPNS